VIQGLNADGLLLAYHDRSDGGLLATGGDGLRRPLRTTASSSATASRVL
jgi:hypothetical protein